MIAGAILEKVLSSALLRICLGVELEHTATVAELDRRDFTFQSTENAFVHTVSAGAFLGRVLSGALVRILFGVEFDETVNGALDHCLCLCLCLLKVYACLNWEIFKQVNLQVIYPNL